MYSPFILCIELHDARVQTKYCQTWRHYITGWAGLQVPAISWVNRSVA